jgi:Domain of unknown function (DUF4174)
MLLSAQNDNKRYVLLFMDSPDNAIGLQQKKILESDKAGCADRDIVLLTYILDKTDKNVLSKYAISNPHFTCLLIGKDGYVALRSNKIVPKAQLFALIDAMPMRRDEMRRKKDR